MKHFNSQEEYEQFVETLANKKDAEVSAQRVAEVAITDIQIVDKDNATMLFNGEPYVETRTTPTEVLLHTVQDTDPSKIDTYCRDVAVNLLANDIERVEKMLTTPIKTEE
jgi:hypothetical protein